MKYIDNKLGLLIIGSIFLGGGLTTIIPLPSKLYGSIVFMLGIILQIISVNMKKSRCIKDEDYS
jgi:hypothetical protein